ncbi:B12-binding domain-containing radical SAM protein [Streptomyces sp. ESR1.13]|uniref:B12-binding domain-containing radical SAM protein n=1 Tax=unclassified Streptomyces TaxID=2593676 RepID=UPI004042484C
MPRSGLERSPEPLPGATTTLTTGELGRVRFLLLSGLGPANLNSPYLEGSLFTAHQSDAAREMLRRAGHADLDLRRLAFTQHGRDYALLRPRSATTPHLTTVTLLSILENSGHGFERLDLGDVWEGRAKAPAGDVDVVLLSTTYIWNGPILASAVRWVRENLPGTPIVAGGQFTNLKFMAAMRDFAEILAVVRGDGEIALPQTLDALAGRGELSAVPNLVWRDGDTIRINPVEYVDIDDFPSPRVLGDQAIVPYESMRGCPFDCKFCSFPAASPKWRYKSAEKIRDDWISYADQNGADVISAMDSTFTIPPTRLRRLLEILPNSGVPRWEGFSRANTLNSADVVAGLVASHCFQLHIGFESMNDGTLKRMSKRVSVKQNRRAAELLSQSGMSYYGLFIVGYPGEDPEMFRDTQDYLLREYSGHYALSKFSITDETMPLWQDREELRIVADDPTDPASPWSHIGMDSAQAARLQKETLDKVRLTNDKTVLSLWQHDYQHWLMPRHDHAANIAVEKCLERMAMAPLDYTDLDEGAAVVRDNLHRLRDFGVELAPPGSRLVCDPI